MTELTQTEMVWAASHSHFEPLYDLGSLETKPNSSFAQTNPHLHVQEILVACTAIFPRVDTETIPDRHSTREFLTNIDRCTSSSAFQGHRIHQTRRQTRISPKVLINRLRGEVRRSKPASREGYTLIARADPSIVGIPVSIEWVSPHQSAWIFRPIVLRANNISPYVVHGPSTESSRRSRALHTSSQGPPRPIRDIVPSRSHVPRPAGVTLATHPLPPAKCFLVCPKEVVRIFSTRRCKGGAVTCVPSSRFNGKGIFTPRTSRAMTRQFARNNRIVTMKGARWLVENHEQYAPQPANLQMPAKFFLPDNFAFLQSIDVSKTQSFDNLSRVTPQQLYGSEFGEFSFSNRAVSQQELKSKRHSDSPYSIARAELSKINVETPWEVENLCFWNTPVPVALLCSQFFFFPQCKLAYSS